MTEAQKKLEELDKRKEEIKKYYEELKSVLDEVSKEIGVNGYFQGSDGCVYKVVEPDGRYVNYEKLAYVRTKRSGEERGTLSAKEAKEKGYNV